MAAAAVANGDATVVVAPTTARLRLEQRLVGITLVQIFPHGSDDEATSRRGWLGFAYWHVTFPLIRLLGAHKGDVVTRREADVSLLPCRLAASCLAVSLDLAERAHYGHADYLDVE